MWVGVAANVSMKTVTLAAASERFKGDNWQDHPVTDTKSLETIFHIHNFVQ